MDNQYPYPASAHRNDWAAADPSDCVVQRVTRRVIVGVLLFAAMGEVSAPAEETVSWSAPPRFSEPAEARGRGHESVAAWNEWPAAATVPSRAPAPGRPEPTGPLEPNAGRAEPWVWQVLPDGILYPSYLAGPKEPRFASVWNHDPHLGWILDLEAGGRVGLLRYGTEGVHRPDGWELDLEGAAFPRLDLEHDWDVTAVDFRVGVPVTFGSGPWRMKLAVYHLSSHLGDEFMLRFPETPRINYSRNALVLGGGYYVTDGLFLYGEAEWAFYTDGGTKPWEFQFGVDYSPVQMAGHVRGSPFLALNGHLREEVDYGGSLVVQGGWQWRGRTNHLFRVGVQYFTGKSDQYQFFDRHEDKVGIGMWYDF